MLKNSVWILYTDEDEIVFTDETLAHAWYDYYYEQLEEAVIIVEKKIHWAKPPYPYWGQMDDNPEEEKNKRPTGTDYWR